MPRLGKLYNSIRRIRTKVIYVRPKIAELLLINDYFIPISSYGEYIDKTYPIINSDGSISKRRKKVREMKPIAEGEIGRFFGKEVRVLR